MVLTRNDKHPEVSYDMFQMVFVILPRFNKAESECETIMDKVLFSLKNGHKLESIPANFTEAELGLLYDLAEISNFTTSELAEYEAAMMNTHDYKATIDYAKKEGEARGRAEGIEKLAALLEKGVPLAEAKRQVTNS
jgi:hypothetical protein